MTPNLQKEFRTLALPAGLILAAVLAGAWAARDAGPVLGYRAWIVQGAMTAFILGIPLLAALPFGSEFQHRTMVLLLSSPVSRTRIWLDKWVAATTVVAGLSAIVFTIILSRAPGGEWPVVPAAGLILLVICSAPLWTLVTRSTLGGLVFAPGLIGLLELVMHYVRYRVTGTFREELFGTSGPLDLVRGLYAAGTLYAGWVVFSRFQAVATGFGALSAGESHAGWAVLRARRSGAIANLLRKELILQRPAFLVTALFAIGWIVGVALVVAGIIGPRGTEVLTAMLLAGHIPLVIVLAGTVPVGEDTSLGLRDWHLTLPVSGFVQWAVKLLVAVAVAVLLTIVLPSLFTYGAGYLTGGRVGGGERFGSPSVQLGVIGAVLVAFWASTMFGDTVKAVVATGAAALAVGLCSALGWRIANWIPFHPAWWSPVTIRFQLPAFYLQAVWLPRVCMAVTQVTVTAIALRQSLSAFRRVRVTPSTVARNSAVLFLVTLALTTFRFNAVESIFSRDFAPAREVREAVMSLPVPADEKRGDPPRSVTLDELDRVRHLSPDARRWLKNATITIKRLPATPITIPSERGPITPMYLVTVQFPNGLRDRFMAGRPR